MKVISGKYKGRKLDGFDIDGTRPTMDRVKESLFAIIQNYISESIVLALSEGAKYAYLVDKNIKCIKAIENNIKNIGIENVKIIHNDYRKVLKDINKKFDLIFLDPPYKTNCIEESIKLIDEYDLLNDNGIIVCESDNIDKIIYTDKFNAIKDRHYGDKYIVLLKKI